MGITEILRRIWLFSASKIKSSESFSKQPTQLIVTNNLSGDLCGLEFSTLQKSRKSKQVIVRLNKLKFISKTNKVHCQHFMHQLLKHVFCNL